MDETVPIQAGDVRRDDRVLRDSVPWVVARVVRIGGTVALTLVDGDRRIKVVYDAQELIRTLVGEM
jgi:hypothetical protein